jgi:hypothetical protein
VIVLDASALVELLLNTNAGRTIAMRIADPALGLHVPHLADIEVGKHSDAMRMRGRSRRRMRRPPSRTSARWICSATPTSRSSSGCGSFAGTSARTMPFTSLSQKCSTPYC